MLNLISNDSGTAIFLIFTNFFTGELEYTTTFDVDAALQIAQDLKIMAQKMKGKKMDKLIKKDKKKIDNMMDTLVKKDIPRDKKIEKCDKDMKKKKNK